MPAITTQHAIPHPGWAGPKPLNLGTSPAAKVWAKRIAAYDLGMAIPKSLIGILRHTVENVYTDDALFRSAIIMKTHYELTWNTKFGWAITPNQMAQGLRWLRRQEVQKLLDESDRAIVADFDHFTFVGLDMVDTSGAHRLSLSVRPVYRVHGKSGKWFDYAPAPWQAGAFGHGGHPSFKLLSRGQA